MIRLREQKVRQLIAKTGLSVKAWGELNGFAQTTLSNWITGARNIKRASLLKLASALNCEPEEISEIYWEFDNSVAIQLEADREEIRGLFGLLSPKQRKVILDMAELIADANRREELANIQAIEQEKGVAF
jgi:transcriptional regulator with XRE-family HTH domain